MTYPYAITYFVLNISFISNGMTKKESELMYHRLSLYSWKRLQQVLKLGDEENMA